MTDVTVSEERLSLLRDAVYEIDKLARMVPDLVTLDDDQAHYGVRGLCGRMLRLTSALMTGLDEQDVPNEKLRRIIELPSPGQG